MLVGILRHCSAGERASPLGKGVQHLHRQSLGNTIIQHGASRGRLENVKERKLSNSWLSDGDGGYDCTTHPTCENVDGNHILPLPPNCNEYMLCQDHKITSVFSCAEGKVFDHRIKTCIIEAMADCPCREYDMHRSYDNTNNVISKAQKSSTLSKSAKSTYVMLSSDESTYDMISSKSGKVKTKTSNKSIGKVDNAKASKSSGKSSSKSTKPLKLSPVEQPTTTKPTEKVTNSPTVSPTTKAQSIEPTETITIPNIITMSPSIKPSTSNPTEIVNDMSMSPTTNSPTESLVITQQPTLTMMSLPPSDEKTTCMSAPGSENFESGIFPISPWTTVGDGNWTIDEGDTYEGMYAVKSPDLSGATSKSISNITISTCDSYEGGTMSFGVRASVLPPTDLFKVYINGEEKLLLIDVNEWKQVTLDILPGSQRIDFSYQYNPFNVDPLPPSPPLREGVVYIDDIVLVETTALSRKFVHSMQEFRFGSGSEVQHTNAGTANLSRLIQGWLYVAFGCGLLAYLG